MKAWGNYECEGQMSMFDLYGQDLWYGKTSPEHSVQTKGKISDAYLKKFAELRIKPPMYLCLQGASGHQVDASWDQESKEYIQWLGEYTMRSFGEYPSEEKESHLSQILEEQAHQKYYLSARACQGILRRAEKRGKELPEILKDALTRQSAFKSEQDAQGGGKGILIQHERTGALSILNNQSVCFEPGAASRIGGHIYDNDVAGTVRANAGDNRQAVVYGMSGYESNAMKSSNPHSGIYKADTTRTLDLNGGNPACNQGGMIVLEGNGQRDSHKGDGYKESDTMYTLNTVEQHAVCYSQDAYDKYTENDKCASLKASGGVYGGGERSDNDSESDRLTYGKRLSEERNTRSDEWYVCCTETVGALCRCDYKGVGNQYVNDGKVIIQRIE